MIFGRTSEARDDVLEAPVVVCSVKIVVLWAIHALLSVSEVLNEVSQREAGTAVSDLLKQWCWWC